LQYILDDSEAKVLIATERHEEKAREILDKGLQSTPTFEIREKIIKSATNESPVLLQEFGEDEKRGGMMLYTSGTTSRPVISSHVMGLMAEL
jgi:acyl-coenzyme A synthetase/AMP-(fatty) acid ligase